MITPFILGALSGGAAVLVYHLICQKRTESVKNRVPLPGFNEILSGVKGRCQKTEANRPSPVPVSPSLHEPVESAEAPSVAAPHNGEVKETFAEPSVVAMLKMETLQPFTQQVQDEMLRTMIQERTAPLMQWQSSDMVRWGLEALSVTEEWRKLLPLYPLPDCEKLQQLIDCLCDIMVQYGFEILDSKTWNPEIQRAVKVNRTADNASEPTIERYFSRGLRYQGILIRKQEIELTLSQNI